MGQTLALAAVGAVTFLVLDGIWLAALMRSLYPDQLAPTGRLADGSIAPNWSVAFGVYPLLGAGIALFVMHRASTIWSGAGYGALLGLVVYGFTNYSTLRQWPFVLVRVDVARGNVASAAYAAVVRIAAR
jgi:uncharacterized membrane protein